MITKQKFIQCSKEFLQTKRVARRMLQIQSSSVRHAENLSRMTDAYSEPKFIEEVRSVQATY